MGVDLTLKYIVSLIALRMQSPLNFKMSLNRNSHEQKWQMNISMPCESCEYTYFLCLPFCLPFWWWDKVTCHAMINDSVGLCSWWWNFCFDDLQSDLLKKKISWKNVSLVVCISCTHAYYIRPRARLSSSHQSIRYEIIFFIIFATYSFTLLLMFMFFYKNSYCHLRPITKTAVLLKK